MLANYIEERLKTRDILLMTHIVAGYPSYDESLNIVRAMVRGGIDLMEFQLPFSEPIADGSVILKANQESLQRGATLEKSFACLQKITEEVEIPVIVMTYFNIIFKYGVERFAEKMSVMGVKGAIIPDLPREEGQKVFKIFSDAGIEPILLVAPTTSVQRMKLLAQHASGFAYCVARKGVTGAKTEMEEELSEYLRQCREQIPVPLAVGFGIQTRDDICSLIGKADIAVVGSEMIRVVERDGVEAVEDFVRRLLGIG